MHQTEQARIRTRKQHKINKQPVTVEILSDLHQESLDSTSSSQISSTTVEYDTLEVSNLPKTASEDHLEAYFESLRSGGCIDAVKSVTMIQPGVAHVQFHDPKGMYTLALCFIQKSCSVPFCFILHNS